MTELKWVAMAWVVLSLGCVSAVLFAAAARTNPAEWGCHTCGRIDKGAFLRLARRRSERHEAEAHARPDPRTELVDALQRELARSQKRVEELDRRRPDESLPPLPRNPEPMSVPPEGDCVDPDGHQMSEVHSMMSIYPVVAICDRCGRQGRVKRDARTPQDAPTTDA